MTEGPPFQDARSMLHHFMRVAGCGNIQAEHIINAYAHELAEHIRDNLGGDGGFPDGMNHAADLIDPQENP